MNSATNNSKCATVGKALKRVFGSVVDLGVAIATCVPARTGSVILVSSAMLMIGQKDIVVELVKRTFR